MGGFPLPAFVAAVLARRPSAPRNVAITSVAWVVLRGADCSIYAGSGFLFVVLGLVAIMTDAGAPRPGVRRTVIGEGLVLVGLLCLALAAFRIWRITLALRTGQAHLAEITDAAAGRARIYGTPWGEPLIAGGMIPIAARGRYRMVNSGETGAYYMQRSWALGLRPGDRIWVLRNGGRDVLYAPAVAVPVPAPAIP